VKSNATKHVEREAEIIEGIERGLADMKAGRLVPHDEAMARLEATISVVDQIRQPHRDPRKHRQ
jgi:predicted transcriptional regulator